MQNFSKAKSVFPIFFSFSILLLLFSSCSPENMATETESLQPEEQEILHYLATNDYNVDAVEFLENFVLYEGDTGWDKTALLATIRGEYAESEVIDPDDPTIIALEGEERQRGIQESNRLDAVLRSEVIDLTFYLRPSLLQHCGADWVTAFQNAAKEWNAISTCLIFFSETTSSFDADIIIGSDIDFGMPSSHRFISGIARAGFPSNGIAWQWISVKASSYTYDSKLKTAMHELGHCIGYRHTGTSDGRQIHGTPYSESGSIMNAGANTNPSFQQGDLRAARMYYADRYDEPTNINVRRSSAGIVKITYRNPKYVSRPYYWIRVYRYSASGAYQGYRDFQSRTTNSSGYHTLYWAGHIPGNAYKYAIRGYNFRRDIFSPRSNQYLVVL